MERALTSLPTDTFVPRLFMLQGSGGTGKTFTYRTLIYRAMQNGVYVLTTASTGTAATLLPNACTTHSAFGLGFKVDPNLLPALESQSVRGRRLRAAKLIIIDEVTMLHKDIVTIVDKLPRHL